MRRLYREFIVAEVTPADSGRLNVAGRCGDLPICVGDTFGAVFRYRPRRSPAESGHAPVRDQERPIRLRVVCIHAYERSLPELGQGMTGSLVLDGDGATEVAPGWILGDPSGEPVSSRLLAQSTT